ncbi:metal-dependent hydrolase [Dongshaea marina]|uniref:metal-dependent hydrolase n=1 Tax=Dongshaea marina TaxID=2047966 RepID=UPI000D3E8919|nr:metal-dependent hydrolase [Dongshaea marina]
MANFHTHASVAIGCSAIAAAALHTAGIIHSQFTMPLILFGSIGGLLPDVDSDHSTSIRVIFNLLSIIGATATMMLVGRDYGIVPGIGAGACFFVIARYIIFYLFTKATRHRGIFHSLPMGVICGLVTASVSWHLLRYSAPNAWLAGLFVSGGFLVHLLLDEIYSVDLSGGRLKSSFLSACKLMSRDSWLLYVGLYLLIGILLIPAPPLTILREQILTAQLAQTLWAHRW